MRERASIVCVDKEKLLLVKLCDPKSGRVFFAPPGGKVESGETPGDAAVRETFEETGCREKISPGIAMIEEYNFFWDGRNVLCRTHYFAAQLESETSIQPADAAYNLGREWCPLSEVFTRVESEGGINAAVVEVIGAMHCSVGVTHVN